MGNTLKEKIQNRLKEAMREQDKPLLSVVRSILKSIVDQEKVSGTTVTEAEETLLLKRMVKQRIDSVEKYKEFNRADLESIELYEIGIIKEYMPVSNELNEEDTRLLIKNLLENGATNIGAVMKYLNDNKVAVDKKLANKIASELIPKPIK